MRYIYTITIIVLIMLVVNLIGALILIENLSKLITIIGTSNNSSEKILAYPIKCTIEEVKE